MLTALQLRSKARFPLHLARLIQPKGDPASLTAAIFCASCRASHEVAWPRTATTLDAVVDLPAPCRDTSSPYLGGMISVALDPRPDHQARHKRILADRSARLASIGHGERMAGMRRSRA